eukprot:3134737-Prymnesium_polylepis.1
MPRGSALGGSATAATWECDRIAREFEPPRYHRRTSLPRSPGSQNGDLFRGEYHPCGREPRCRESPAAQRCTHLDRKLPSAEIEAPELGDASVPDVEERHLPAKAGNEQILLGGIHAVHQQAEAVDRDVLIKLSSDRTLIEKSVRKRPGPHLHLAQKDATAEAELRAVVKEDGGRNDQCRTRLRHVTVTLRRRAMACAARGRCSLRSLPASEAEGSDARPM